MGSLASLLALSVRNNFGISEGVYWGACIAHIAEAGVEPHVGFAWAYNRLSVKLRKVFLKGEQHDNLNHRGRDRRHAKISSGATGGYPYKREQPTDISRARSELGYKPEFDTIEKAIEDYAEWIRVNGF